MSTPGADLPDPFVDALFAARCCAIDPGLGGMILRGGDHLRDAVIAELRAALPDDAPVRRIPLHIDDERLAGGIDLAATLARGAATASTGVLAEVDGGLLIVPMAERIADTTAGRIAATLDSGEVSVDQGGLLTRNDTRFCVLAMDDGAEPDERPPASLAERLACQIDLSTVHPDRVRRYFKGIGAKSGRALTRPAASDQDVALADGPEVLVATAAALGIESARAVHFALRVARASARLAGRLAIGEEDIVTAARIVLAPRATRIPDDETQAPADPPSPSPPSNEADSGEQDKNDLRPPEDIVLAATLAALPKDVLARIAAGQSRRSAQRSTAGAGERRKSSARGRPLGARPGMPTGGARLSLIDTLRAAAPWQKLRSGTAPIKIRRDDLRVRRFETRAEAVTIFAVDASGSSALARLAEAKGAVELLLAEAYVKRAQVALIAFRGTSAELLLAPTRSLARARRSLAELPGGGGTPLAAGLHAARELAELARARGRTPFIVVLTDGRANIAADGTASRSAAETDASDAAAAIGNAGIASAFVDISARPRPEGAALAEKMRAKYLPLPRADAGAINAAVGAARRG